MTLTRTLRRTCLSLALRAKASYSNSSAPTYPPDVRSRELGRALGGAMAGLSAEPLEQDEPDDRADGKGKDRKTRPEDRGPVGPMRRDADECNVEREGDGDGQSGGDSEGNRAHRSLDEGRQEGADAKGEDHERDGGGSDCLAYRRLLYVELQSRKGFAPTLRRDPLVQHLAASSPGSIAGGGFLEQSKASLCCWLDGHACLHLASTVAAF